MKKRKRMEAKEEKKVQTIGFKLALIIPLIGSLMLLALFFFLNMLFVFLVILFCVSSFFSCIMFLFPVEKVLIRKAFPRIPKRQRITIRGTTYEEPFIDALICALITIGLIVGWLVTTHWIFVDLLAICVASEAIKLVIISISKKFNK